MGIYDRDYAREEGPIGLQLDGAIHTATVRLIIANVVIYLCAEFIFHGQAWVRELSLSSNVFQEPWKIFQFLTYGFMHAGLVTETLKDGEIVRENGIFHILYNMVGLIMFGLAVERKLSAREYVSFYFVAMLAAGLAFVGIHSAFSEGPKTVVGASGSVVAIVVLFCLTHYDQEVTLLGGFRVKGWQLGLVYLVLDVINALRSERTSWQAHLGGALFALAYFKSGLRLSNWVPQKLPWTSSKPKLKVKSAEDEEDLDRVDFYEDLDREGDRIVEKYTQEGADSLTPRERKILEDYSRRMRHKHR